MMLIIYTKNALNLTDMVLDGRMEGRVVGLDGCANARTDNA